MRLLDHELNGARTAEQVSLRRRLGFIFQAHNLHGSLTARQNVQIGLEVHGRGSDDAYLEAADHMLGLVGLGERLDYLPGNLSGGQKQRVAVARALVGSGRTVVEMLKALGRERGTTTVMVTHDNRILDLADRIVTLEDGRIVEDRSQ